MAAVNGQTEALQTLLFYKADFEKTVEDDSGSPQLRFIAFGAVSVRFFESRQPFLTLRGA